MIVAVLDPEITMTAEGQGPGLVRGGGHVIVIMTGDSLALGHMIVTMREGALVRDLERH